LTFLLVGLSGANAQTAISATSTNTNSPLLRANGKIAFVYRRQTSPQDYNAGIYTMNPDGSGRTQLTSNQLICVVGSVHTICDYEPEDIDPAWSPDGTQIAFTRSSSSNQIFVMNADGSNQRRLTQSGNDRYPTWSPDGTKIAFLSSSCPGCSATTIYVMNADGSDQRIILVSDAHHYYFGLAWSPDGSKLAVTNGLYIFSVNVDGSNRTQITTPGPGAYDSNIAWSPDGSKIAFLRSANCDWNDCYDVSIWTVNPDGSNPTKLADVYGYNLNWSPDGTKIVFASIGANGHSNLFVMNADGSGVTNITNTPDAGEFSYPSWQPLLITTPPIGNPLDDAQFFVRQHYRDFLNREPDAGGLDYWTGEILKCGSDARCLHERRLAVSAAFFVEQEFQDTGYFVYRFYKAALGRQPNYAEFTADRSKVVDGPSLEANKQAFADEWVQRPAFVSAYPNTMSNTEFVNKLFNSAGLTASLYNAQRQQEIQAMNAGRSRVLVLRNVIETPDFKNIPDPAGPRYTEIKQTSQYNPAFVLMEYFGYLRRNVDQGGYDFWLDVVNNRAPNNYRGMVCAFLTSTEYQHRFGSVVTRSNADCSQ